MTADQILLFIVTDESGLNLLQAVKSKCMHIYFVNIHQLPVKDFTVLTKVLETFNELIRQLRIDLRLKYERHFHFHIFTSTAQSVQLLDKASAEFIWFHALIDEMQRFKQSQATSAKWYRAVKDDMLNKCRLECNTNSVTLRQIVVFEETYKEVDVIKWYTADTFVYRLINKALRSNNIEEIINYRFFIADLYCQVKILCEEEFSGKNALLKVYRGQGVSKNDFDILKKNVGNLITIKSFLSTSWDINVALSFGITQIGVDDIEPVLFVIQLDTTLREKPFASISAFTPMNEEEVLLSMGFVFHIEKIIFDQTMNVWVVELISKPETEQVKQLLKHIKTDLNGSDLGYILYGMGEYTAALRYCKWYNEICNSSDESSDNCYNLMAIIYKALKLPDDAFVYIKKSAFELFERKLSRPFIDNYIFAQFYYNLGLIYLEKENFYSAIYACQKALEVMKAAADDLLLIFKDQASAVDLESLKTWGGNSDHLAKIYNNLGSAYTELKQYPVAFHYLSKALELQQKHLPIMHYYNAITYINLGSLYKATMDYQNALKYFMRGIDILKFSRQPTHSSITSTYEKIAEVNEMKHNYPMALENYQNACHHIRGIHKIVAQLMHIARIYHKMNNHKQAIEMSERAARLCREHSLPMTNLFNKNDTIMVPRQRSKNIP